jgi:hypothetical protein
MAVSDLIELAKRQAAEIACAGHNGWGNTMLELAAALEAAREDAERYRFIAADHSAAWEEELDAAIAAQKQGQAVAVELTRDAERYKWLRERAWLHPEDAPACAIFGVDGSMLRSIDGSDLDAAIDQARGASSEAAP